MFFVLFPYRGISQFFKPKKTFFILHLIFTFARHKSAVVKRSKKITIPVSGMKTGTHHFEFEIGQSFFNEYDHPDILDGSFKIDLQLGKSEPVSTLHYSFKGTVTVPCDVCLDPFDLPIDGEELLYVKTDPDFMDETNEEVLYLSESENEIDLSQHVYDSVCIRFPFRKAHPEDENGEPGCNPEMLEKINKHRHVSDENESTDPRWNDLKKFLEDNNQI